MARILNIANAKIVLRNFSGKPDEFNPKGGKRKFHMLLTPEDAEELLEQGWNVKWFKPKEDGLPPQAHLEITVAFENVPPKIIMITGNVQKKLNEQTVDELDTAEIEKVDLVVTPYHWSMNGRSGVKAYVKAMYVTIVEDEFAKNYRLSDDEPPFARD